MPLLPLVLVGVAMTLSVFGAFFGVPILLLVFRPWWVDLRIGRVWGPAAGLTASAAIHLGLCAAVVAGTDVVLAVLGRDDLDSVVDAAFWLMFTVMVVSLVVGRSASSDLSSQDQPRVAIAGETLGTGGRSLKDMSDGVWILGTSQTDFARSVAKEGREVDALVGEAAAAALDDAGIGPERVGVIHVGNAFGQLMTGQGHLGAMPATVDERFWGTPSSRHEAACASGSIAALSAMADLESGRYDVALVLGVEVERSVPGDDASGHLGAASWVGHEGTPRFVWPAQFSDLADEYDRRYGLDDDHLRAFAAQAFSQARDNPKAQTRGWCFTDASFTGDDHANPVVEGRTRRNDCSQITDGAAAVVLASDRAVRADPGLLRRRAVARIDGWGHRSVGLTMDHKLERSAEDTHVLPHVRDTFADALGRAHLGAVDDLDAVEVHDCFAMSGYMAIDHLGITAPGDSWKAIESGEVARDGRLPVNPGGGLIGGGHPVGATGVRMLVDATRQVTEQAGPTQVDGARRVGTLNIGGSTATTCAFVVAAPDRA